MSLSVLSVGNMYPPHSLGGYEVTWRAGVAALRAAGHRVRVLTTDFRLAGATGAEDADVHRELKWYWRDHAFPRLTLRERLRLERHNASLLARHLDEVRPDVVDWWAMGGMSLGLVEAARRRGIPAVGVVGDDWMVYGPSVDGWQRAARRARPLRPVLERLAGLPASVDLGAAATWLFNSEATRSAALATGVELPRSAVVHPGVDLDLLTPAEAGEWEGRLLFCGRLDPRKGAHVAIDALEHLPGASLRIVGGGDRHYLDELRGRAKRGGLGDRVEFSEVGRAEVRSAYARADALLFPSLWEEPWGLVPLEAMAVGVPVVATGSGGSAEYLRDGENSLIYRPREDPRALAAAVERLAADAGLRRALRAGGFETAGRHPASAYERAHLEAVERAAAGQSRAGSPTTTA
jgi:glycosyltransferase involved in cell wall biosynthesis